MIELICKILKIGKATYYRYKKDNEPIYKFMQQFTVEELHEIQKSGITKKLKLIQNYSYEELENKLQSKQKFSDNYMTANLRYKINMSEKQLIYKKMLNKVLSENDFSKYKIINKMDVNQSQVKIDFLLAINNYPVKLLEYKEWKINTLSFVENYISDEESYLLIKYPEKFLKE